MTLPEALGRSVGWSSTLYLATFLVAFLLGLSAHAQDTADTAVLEEVIVTAKKRKQDIQNIPISITVISAMGDGQIESISDILDATLGITSGDGINIRGVGSSTPGSGAEPGVVFLADGEILDESANLIRNLSDNAHIEILRGPQGTSTKNGPAGLIRTISKRPKLHGDMNAYITFDIAVKDAYSVKAAVAAPISDGVAYRFNGYYRDEGGWLENTYSGNPNGGKSAGYGLRGQLLVSSPAEDLKILFRADYSKRDSNNPGSVVTQADNPDNKFFTLTGQEYGKDVDSNTMDKTQLSEQETWGMFTEITKFSRGFNLVYRRYYRDSRRRSNDDPDDNAILFSNASFGGSNTAKSTQHEFHMASPADKKYDYVADILYHHVENEREGLNERCTNGFEFEAANFSEDRKAERIAAVDPETLKVISCNGTLAGGADAYPWNREDSVVTDYTVDNLAAVGHFNYHISPALTIFVSGRWRRNERELVYEGGLDEVPFFKDTTEDTNFTYKYGGQYHISDDFMVYASYGTGYKNGGIINTSNARLEDIQNPVGPEKSKAYEAGFRSDWMDRKLRWNATVFLTDYEDFQQRVQVQDEDAELLFTTRFISAGVVRTQGLEMDMQYRLTNALRFRLGVSYLDSRFIDEEGKLATNCPDEFDDSSLVCDPVFNVLFLNNVRRPNAPEWQANLRATYWFKLGKYPSSLGLNYKWTHETTRSLNHDQAKSLDAQDKLDMRFNTSSPDRKYSLSVYVSNVLDDRIIFSRDVFASSFGGGRIENLDRHYERTLRMTVTTRF